MKKCFDDFVFYLLYNKVRLWRLLYPDYLQLAFQVLLCSHMQWKTGFIGCLRNL